MSPEHGASVDPRVTKALTTLENQIRSRYPEATFRIYRGEDPDGYYLEPTVDADLDAVLDVVMPQLWEWSINELPVYVVPVLPSECVAADLREPPAIRDSRRMAQRLVHG